MTIGFVLMDFFSVEENTAPVQFTLEDFQTFLKYFPGCLTPLTERCLNFVSICLCESVFLWEISSTGITEKFVPFQEVCSYFLYILPSFKAFLYKLIYFPLYGNIL